MVDGRKVTITEHLGPYDPQTDAVKERRICGKQRPRTEIIAYKEEMDVRSLLYSIANQHRLVCLRGIEEEPRLHKLVRHLIAGGAL